MKQRKSDVSDLRNLYWQNSGTPEFSGMRESRIALGSIRATLADCRKAALDKCKALAYTIGVIRSFRDRALERFFATGDGRRLSVQNTGRIANILRALDDASRPEDMNLPGFRFHGLVGRNRGRYAVNASGNWRITFGWLEGDAIDVDLEDYH
jgi:proteic killer suppression protein